MKKDDLYCNNSRYSFVKHIAPVLNDLEEENEEDIYSSPKTYGNLVYDMCFTSEGKEALRSFYADTCEEMTDGDITWFETICKEADEDYDYWQREADKARERREEAEADDDGDDNLYELGREVEACENSAEEVLRDTAGKIFEWVLQDSDYIELDNESATDAGEYRRVYIYLSELLWKEAHRKNRLSYTVYNIIDGATANWKDAQDYC